MADPYPSSFHRYRSLAGESLEFVKDILLNDRLYWTSPDKFNDPFDCWPVAVMPQSRLKLESLAKQLVERRLRDVPKHERKKAFPGVMANMRRAAENPTKLLRDRLASIAVCSLAAEPDNLLMWSHYADSHRGVCLRFRPTKSDGLGFFPLPVVYANERPLVDLLEGRDNEWAEKIMLTKADCWAYEREFRLLDASASGGGFHKFRHGILDAVFLGALIGEENRSLVRGWAADRGGTRVFQMKFDDRRFRLHFDPS
jgi:hypothetical protein